MALATGSMECSVAVKFREMKVVERPVIRGASAPALSAIKFFTIAFAPLA
jgi:hypothetical protein